MRTQTNVAPTFPSSQRRGGCATIKRCEATEAAQTGWSDRHADFAGLTTPALRATPPLRGGEFFKIVCLMLLVVLAAAPTAVLAQQDAEKAQPKTEAAQKQTEESQAQTQTDKDGKLIPVPGGKALGMSILGNQEAPKALVIVPWKRSELGNSLSISTMLDDSRLPIDKDVFMRMLSYYEIRSETARPAGAPAKTNAAQPNTAAPRRK